MMKKIFFLSTMIFSFSALAEFTFPGAPAAAPAPAPATATNAAKSQDDTHAKISGVPRLVRDYPSPQVFFEDPKIESYYIPTSDSYNRIMEALTAGLKSKSPVEMVVNKRTKMILDVSTPKSSSSGSIYEDAPEDYSSKNQAQVPARSGAVLPAGMVTTPAAPAAPTTGWGQ